MDWIEQIKRTVNITDLVARLGLKPNSSNFIYSIYKQEKTPSLKLYPESNSFYCFSSDIGGDLVKFYEDYYNTSTKDAIKGISFLFGIVGYNNQRKQSLQKADNSDSIKLLGSEKESFEEKAARFQFENDLSKAKAEKEAFKLITLGRKEIQCKVYESIYEFCSKAGIDEKIYSYLTGKNRGLTDETIAKFKIFSISSVSKLIEFLKDNFSRDELVISGLFKSKYFMFTKHRLIIPYVENGKITYMRGRFFYDGSFEPEGMGKYIGLYNWSLTLKAKRFYNIDVIEKVCPFDKLFIAEGEFDTMILEQLGIKAIGVPGVTNFPKDQITKIDHFDIFLAFDNDQAGDKAVFDVAKAFNKPVKVLRLENYKDISELVCRTTQKY